MAGIMIRGLLCLYPRAWRDRYGDELAGLIDEARGNRRPSLRLISNVASSGIRQRLQRIGLVGDDLTPDDRTQSGLVLVMWSWMLFVLGGIGIEKSSEHWKAAVPAAKAGVPTLAFAALFVVAAIASSLVLAGVAVAATPLVPFLRARGWKQIRRPIYRAGAVTGLVAIGLVALSVWAGHLTATQRNGDDTAFSAAVLAWAFLFACCLFSWAAAAVSIVRQLTIRKPVLTVVTRIAAAVTASMVVMTIASAVWWAAIAQEAPWFLAGRASGSGGSVTPITLVIAVATMLVATLLASVGIRRSLLNVRLLQRVTRSE